VLSLSVSLMAEIVCDVPRHNLHVNRTKFKFATENGEKMKQSLELGALSVHDDGAT